MRKEGSALLKTVKNKVKETWKLFFSTVFIALLPVGIVPPALFVSLFTLIHETFCVNVMLIYNCVKL
jgi:hypothetical protein